MSDLKPCQFCGVDLAMSNDNCAVAVVFEDDDEIFCDVELEEAIAGIDELCGTLDNMNSNGVIGYGDYSQLFDLLCCVQERIEAAQSEKKVVAP